MGDLRDPEYNKWYYRTCCFGDSAPLCMPENYEWPRLEFLWKQACGPVLDVGCGTGDFTAHLNRHGFRCVGLDPSERHIQAAKERYPREGLHYVQLPLEDYALKVRAQFGLLQPFGSALIGDVIEHVPYPAALLQMAHCLARVVVATTPHGEWDSPEHIHVFDEGGIHALAAQVGARVHSICDREGQPRWWGLVIGEGVRYVSESPAKTPYVAPAE